MVRARLRDLISHHDDRMLAIEEACVEPKVETATGFVQSQTRSAANYDGFGRGYCPRASVDSPQ